MRGEAWMVGQWVATLSDPGCPYSCFSKEAERAQKNFVTCLGLQIWPSSLACLVPKQVLCRTMQKGSSDLVLCMGFSSWPFSFEFEGNGEDVQWRLRSRAQLPAPDTDPAPDRSWPTPPFLGQSQGSALQLLICGSLWSQGPTSEEKNHCGQWHRAKHSSVHLKMNNV